MKKIQTLCLIQNKDSILLAMKKRGFGKGWWNGFGGKVKPGETIKQALKRELKEEAGIDLIKAKKRGILNFEFLGDPIIIEVHLFEAIKYSGEPQETEEMKPKWFLKTKIPYKKMWSDDIHWLPLFLAGKNFKGRFVFDKKGKVSKHDLKVKK